MKERGKKKGKLRNSTLFFPQLNRSPLIKKINISHTKLITETFNYNNIIKILRKKSKLNYPKSCGSLYGKKGAQIKERKKKKGKKKVIATNF